MSSWRQCSAIVVLTILTGLPLVGTVCAMVCDRTSGTVAAHHSSRPCEQQDQPSGETAISAAPQHDCGSHQTTIRQIATPAAERGWATAVWVPSSIIPTRTPAATAPGFQSTFDGTTLPDSTPPTAAPLVLRV